MRIGILTFHFSENFGALLQAYALRTYLKQAGFVAEFINYHPRYVEGGRFCFALSNQAAKQNLKTLFLQFARLRTKVSYSQNLIATEQFRETFLDVSGSRFFTKRELEAADVSYDTLICGSDQIWSPSSQFGLDPVYFLDFKSQATRKISYAASFGSTSLPHEFHHSARAYLGTLNSVSVRERLGADFASTLIDRRVDCVPDPTFLLDDYSDLVDANSYDNKDHIFFYILRSAEGSHRIADALTQDLKLPVISGFNPLRRWRKIGQIVPGGPKEWLNALASSKLVVSNSFHATAFSLLLNVPFIAVRLPGQRSRLSARLQSVLTDVGLEDRIIEAGDLPKALRLAREEIDWTPVNQRIDQMRVHGQSYLLESLGKETLDPMPLQSIFGN